MATAVKKPPAPKVALSVDADIIVKASRKDSGRCMVADTIRAQVPGASAILVDVGTIRWTDRAAGYRYTYLTPLMVRGAIALFDQGVVVQPFKFKLSKAVQVSPCRAKRIGANPKNRLVSPPAATAVVDAVGDVTIIGGRPIPSDASVGTSGAHRDRDRDARTRNIGGTNRKQRVFGLREMTPAVIAALNSPDYRPDLSTVS